MFDLFEASTLAYRLASVGGAYYLPRVFRHNAKLWILVSSGHAAVVAPAVAEDFCTQSDMVTEMEPHLAGGKRITDSAVDGIVENILRRGFVPPAAVDVGTLLDWCRGGGPGLLRTEAMPRSSEWWIDRRLLGEVISGAFENQAEDLSIAWIETPPPQCGPALVIGCDGESDRRGIVMGLDPKLAVPPNQFTASRETLAYFSDYNGYGSSGSLDTARRMG